MNVVSVLILGALTGCFVHVVMNPNSVLTLNW